MKTYELAYTQPHHLMRSETTDPFGVNEALQRGRAQEPRYRPLRAHWLALSRPRDIFMSRIMPSPSERVRRHTVNMVMSTGNTMEAVRMRFPPTSSPR